MQCWRLALNRVQASLALGCQQYFYLLQGGLLGMVPFDPMGQISDKNRQSEVRNGR